MYRNITIILTLVICLSLLLVFQPWKSNQKLPPRIFDRLPEAQLIGQSDILSLSRSLSKTLFYYKIPFRDFLSANFILSQGKNYGLDFQAPVYFFANEKNYELFDIGALLTVKDSSEIGEGITRIKSQVELLDTIVHKQKVYKYTEGNIYMTYGKNWMFIYKGNSFPKLLKGILSAKRNEINPRWRDFINNGSLERDHLSAQIQTEKLKKLGVDYVNISLTNDSTDFIFHSSVTHIDTLSYQLRAIGPSYEPKEFSNKLVNLHFDVDRLRNNPRDPIYIAAKNYGSKIGFPVDLFFKAWNGDVSFRQGGIQVIKEKYIESELDENFNVSELVKYRDVKISGFSFYLSLNKNGKSLLTQLYEKGILTHTDNKFRVLYSPPLNLKVTDTSLAMYTGKYLPALRHDSLNEIIWTFNYTPVRLTLDSTSTKTVYGKVRLPLKKLVNDYVSIL